MESNFNAENTRGIWQIQNFSFEDSSNDKHYLLLQVAKDSDLKLTLEIYRIEIF